MYRYSRRDAESAFERLAEASGARIAQPEWKITDRRREGAWLLDHNSVYGGFVIAAYVQDSPPRDGRRQAYTAITHPLGDGRRSAREFVEACNFAIRAIGFRSERRSRRSR